MEKINKCDSSKTQFRCISRLFLNDEKGFYILHNHRRFYGVCMRRMPQASKRIRILTHKLLFFIPAYKGEY